MAAYDHWGTKAVSKFNGMWAFALFDKEKNQIFMSRDRYSIKPLIYSKLNRKFIFGSELKQFLGIEGFDREVNLHNSARFLAKGRLNQGADTLLKNVYELPGGHNLTYDLNTHQI